MKRMIGWLLIISSLFGQQALANEADPDQPQTGLLLMRNGAESEWQAALLLNTDIDVQINGPVAEVRIRQRFTNPGERFSEGEYVLPMSENAAVHAMTLDIGERHIVGEIHEKAEAKAIYEKAKANGQQTGLTEQRRPNLFSTSVANIATGETISVTLEYTELLIPDANQFSLRLPLTMTPRYTAAQPLEFGETPAPAVEGRIVQQQWTDAPSHQARLNIYLDGGMELQQIHSPSHPLTANYDGRGYQVELANNTVIMERDFILEWQLPTDAGNQASIFTETVDGEQYAMLMLSPAAREAISQRQPREVILIIDTSGSMQGSRMRQARESLLYAIQRLEPEDRFNVLEFNSDYSELFQEPRQASKANRDTATEWVAQLEASGGTEMLPVIANALGQQGEQGYLRQLIFITDGSVSNEQEVLTLINRRLDTSRLFTVGIGAAPNNYLLRKAADIGRGQFTSVSDGQGVSAAMNQLFSKLEAPVLTNLRIAMDEGVSAEIWPEKLPDLYADQPLVVAMKLNRLPRSITLYGNQPEPWQQELDVPQAQQHKGVSTLWARSKIESLMDRITQGEPEPIIREAVLEVALRHQLLSRYTSFVAVDKTPVRQAQEPLNSQQIPNLNPIDHQAYPQTSLGLLQIWLLAAMLLMAGLAMLYWQRPRHA